MIICPSCHTTYEDKETRFCGRCGSDLAKVSAARTAPQKTFDDAAGDRFIGTTVDGRYRVIARIGAGGMGAVYKVEHLAMGKMAAMKVLHASLTQDREVAQRFRREAEAVSKLSSPNTVQVFDFGESGGSMYLVMELCKGEDLGAILRRDGPMPFARLGPMMVQVCDALSEAHELGIVHRDLKPENLLVSRARDGHDIVKVLDFGLAKLRDNEELNQVTARGSLIGTPFYMSPEQIRAEELDARSDIYSLGALMYRVLTGVHPFTAATPVAVLTQHLTEELIPLTKRKPELKIGSRVEAIVMKAMAKRREERYASADDLKLALAEASLAASQRISTISAEMRRASDEGDPSVSTPIGASSKLRREDFDAYERGLKRKRWFALSIVPIVGLALGVVAFVVFTRVDPELKVRDYEREPNNTPATANTVASGRAVKGQVGKRIALEESDRDFYRFRVAGGEAMVLRAELSGIPNMELMLEVFDAQGKRVAEADNGGVGDGELIPNLKLGPGEHYIAVREVWTAGRPATENISDWYTLTATWAPPTVGHEVEPDDSAGTALAVAPAEPMRGYLGRVDDVDYYYVRGEGGGTLSGEVTGVAGADVRLVVLPGGATTGPPGPLPPGAKVFDAGGVGAPERFDGVAWPTGARAPLVVVERKLPRAVADRRTSPSGLDTEYTLSLKLRP
ncbi:MAG: serine/threonine protein kinase [Myxococcales bacterium]|nr:serine/threonine protein kinase [Myxococcales bacterium]